MSNTIQLTKPVRNVRTNKSQFAVYAFPSWEQQRSEKKQQAKQHVVQQVLQLEQIKNEAIQEPVTIENFSTAYNQGFEDGKQAVREELQKEFEEKLHEEQRVTLIKTIGQLETLISNIQKEFFQLQAKSEEVVLRFALAVAQQIVKREIQCDNGIVLQQIRESLRRVLGVEHIKVRVNPEDEAIVRENKPAILGGSDSLREIVIESDEKVERGGCILESESGNVDARISTQMKKIEAALIDDGVLVSP